LGFLEDPFDVAPDPRFLYLSSQHGPILDRLHNLVERRRGLAVVDGTTGLGKTMIARRLESFYRARSGEYKVAFIDRPSFVSEYTAYVALSTAFNLRPRKGVDGQFSELSDFVKRTTQDGRVVLFIVDQAETLNPDALSAIDKVSQEIAPAFLFGQEKVQLALAELPEALGRAIRFTLTPLSLRDAIGLIGYRCRVAGRDDPPFSEEAMEFIWEAARGVPEDLVDLCNFAIADLRSLQGTFINVDIARTASESRASFTTLSSEIVEAGIEEPLEED
jgi:general secretion pathway protein A